VYTSADVALRACVDDRRLNVRMPGNKEWPLSLATLDDVATAIMRRRLGYVFDWSRVSSLEARRR
jgi:hypothetical protein